MDTVSLFVEKKNNFHLFILVQTKFLCDNWITTLANHSIVLLCVIYSWKFVSMTKYEFVISNQCLWKTRIRIQHFTKLVQFGVLIWMEQNASRSDTQLKYWYDVSSECDFHRITAQQLTRTNSWNCVNRLTCQH